MLKPKPNIILFITHDQGELLGCYSSASDPNSVHTPNLDRVGESGVRFVNHFCTAPQCSPSRGSIQTSRYPHQNGLMGLVNRGWTLPHTNKTLPMYLKDHGYTTHLIGFQHESEDVTTLGYDSVSPRGPEFKYSPVLIEKEYHRFLEEHRNDEKPFFLCIGTPEVHRPFVAWAEPVPPEDVTVPPFLPDEFLIRVDLAELYGAVEAVDRTVGRVIDSLKRTGLYQHTLFIYTTEHGIAFPRAKCTLYDAGIKVLMLMHWPGSPYFSGGKAIPALISHIDLLPTLLELIDAPIPTDLEGRSYLPVLTSEKATVRDAIFAEKTFHEIYHPMRCIRTERYKYIRNFKPLPTAYHIPKDISHDFSGLVMQRQPSYHRSQPDEELFDLENDPHEMENLISDPDHGALADELRHRLEEWMEATNDPLLQGAVEPQAKVVTDYETIERKEALYLPLLTLVQMVMRNRYGRELLTRLAKHLS